MLKTLLITLCAASVHSAIVLGGDAAKPPKITRGTQMDYGQFLTYMVKLPQAKGAPKGSVIASPKGIHIKLAKDAFICFDPDTLRYFAAWKGEFISVARTNIGDLKGEEPAILTADLQISTKNGPGWSRNGDFKDPRHEGLGPLPAEYGHYSGLYVSGEKTLLAYKVGDAEILELPGVIEDGGVTVFTRTICIKKSSTPLSVLISDSGNAAALLKDGAALAEIKNTDGRVVANVKAAAPAEFTLFIGAKDVSEAQVQAAAAKFQTVPDLTELCKGSPPRLGPPITMAGTIGGGNEPYVVDSIPLPENTPGNSWMRLSAFDFLPDGRAVVSTMNGEVWIVSGLDEKLDKVTWKRYATGLFEPLGLKVVDGVIYVLGRDQITRFHDLNNDGEADFYENFNNDTTVHPHYHTFAFDLQTDKAGNFYFVRGGNWVPTGFEPHGMVKVSKDGSTSELYATGFRAPNGMSIGPNDEITTGDNQGHWIPASKINFVKKGGFYGHCGDPRTVDFKTAKNVPTDYEKPIWVPYTADNSSGGQVWVTSDKWGPFKNHLLHMSYGKCTLFHVMPEESKGQMQGGVVKFPLAFASGIMRGRFSPVDGQLYLCGLKGWQTSAGKDGTFNRVRYTGKPVHMPLEMHVKPDAISITFTSALDKASASDEQSYGVEQWNYKWWSTYGSPDFSVAEPEKKGHDPVAIKGVTLSDDHKTITLQIPGLKPVMQMRIQCNIKAEDGSPVIGEIFNTINAAP